MAEQPIPNPVAGNPAPQGTPDVKTPDATTPGDNKEVLFETIVPEEFRDRAYLKDLMSQKIGPESYKELFKKLDGAEKLVGTKTGIPKEDAPVEEWNQFFNKLRPQSADAYEIKVKEGETVDPELIKSLKGMFHKAGLSKVQAKILQEDFSALVNSQTEAQRKEMEKLDAEFSELSAKTFGADNEKVLARANEMLKTLTPESLKPHVGRLSNEALVILTGILNEVHNRYITEDKINTPNAAGAPGLDELREQARKLMASDAYRNAFNPKHDQVRAEVEALYKRISGASQK